MSIKRKARLENWAIYGFNYLFAKPVREDVLDGRMEGNVYDHHALDQDPRRVEDGTHVTTSHIVDADLAAGWVQTGNTFYVLGKPNARYAQFCKDNGVELPPAIDYATLELKVLATVKPEEIKKYMEVAA